MSQTHVGIPYPSKAHFFEDQSVVFRHCGGSDNYKFVIILCTERKNLSPLFCSNQIIMFKNKLSLQMIYGHVGILNVKTFYKNGKKTNGTTKNPRIDYVYEKVCS